MNKRKNIKQLPKYRPKDCWNCDQNQEENINTLCNFHLKYSYQRILREQRKDIQFQSVLRIIFVAITSAFITFIFWFFIAVEFGWLTVVIFIYSGFILCLILYTFIHCERNFKKWLANRQKDKVEWTRN